MTLDRDRVARALPGYEIGEEVGRGAWGVVIRATHRQLGREVAVKELPQAFAADPGVRRRFVSEARLLATLDHPHIVPIYDYVEGEGLCLLVMELLSGGTVWSRFTTAGVSAEAACGIVLAASSALQHAHGKGILHRDIKPENLLFTRNGTLKVSDFGIAKVVGGAESMATRTGDVLGTPAYMAPEQALGRDLTPATDVYALGTVLYELLSGRLPFVDDGNAIALLYRHVHEQPVALGDVAADLPPAMVETVMRALATEPSERQSTAEDLGLAVADAANDMWGGGWVVRGGVNVMATGPIGERISGGARSSGTGSDVAGAPVMPVASPPARVTRSGRAPETVLEPAPDAQEIGAQEIGAGSDPHGDAEVTTATPEELVPVQEVMAPASAPPTAGPAIAAAAPEVTAPRARQTPRRAGRAPLVLFAIVVVLAVAAAAIVLAGGGGGNDSGTSPPAGPPTVAATIPVGAGADHVTFGAGGIWVTQGAARALLHVDPATNAVSSVATPNVTPHSIAVDGDKLWVTTANGGPLLLVQPGTPAQIRSAPVGAAVAEVAVGGGSVWLTAPQTGQLLRVDPGTLQVTARIPIGASADSVEYGDGAVWVARRIGAGTVTRIDPGNGHVVATIPVGVNPDQLAIGSDAVWVANSGNNTVSRIDPATNQVTATIPAGAGSSSLIVGAGAVWVSNSAANSVSRVDPATNRVTDTVPVGGGPGSITVGADDVWVVNTTSGTLSRVHP